MRLALSFLILCPLLYVVHGATNDDVQLLHQLQVQFKQFQSSVKQTVSGLARQMMLQQLFVEERVRSDGSSGVKQIRNNGGGSRPYHYNTYSSHAFLSIHEHSNYDRTVGLGEFIGVLNGVEFRTRHNDFKLRMPSTTKSDYHAMEDIPFPEVPPSVRSKTTVLEQVAEMQQYFKAFRDQNPKLRNYSPYFKPVLCYLEGGWTTDTKKLDEPFHSDRHFIDASSWFDLQQKIQYMSSTGGKNQFENLSYLPTTIVNVTDDGEPVYAQWNYRILCHPIKHDLKLADLKPVDDLSSRMGYYSNRNYSYYTRHSKQVRFTVAPSRGRDYHADDGFGSYDDRRYTFGTMDAIMNEIPGVDNYPGHLTDNSFGLLKHRIDVKNATVLNTARYHRHYKVNRKGAMGLTVRNRGYSDTSLWVAQTKNPKIAKFNVKDCQRNQRTHKMDCINYEARTTYAVPLEIIWLTPLSSWNPYNLRLLSKDYRQFHTVTDGGRNGDLSKAKAFNGTSLQNYYLTPAEFFHGGEANRDPADTARDTVGVLDQHGEVKRVTASGIRIFTPDIPGVGKLRIRYPIAPLHQEGSAAWKNLAAIEDMMMDMNKYSKVFEHKPQIKDLNVHEDAHYKTSTTHSNPPGMHYHDIYLTAEEVKALHNNQTIVSVYTTENNGHQHELELKRDPHRHDLNRLHIVSCDGNTHCWDHHNNNAYIVRT
ncbi:uncharacterized protein LOC123546767 [Mercenaria mercenaria]|uniref:uncharacterized protein LOC123546767 n=1 Tax=Mercenaria mercenaria TaxID=6596 RepID=UPI00234E3988|nr:uncharacterized protein LOC123546767 [Mercenaria mercenaria]